MNNTALNNLLSVNRRALQGLHAIAHMDFTKPYILIEKHGKFTHKSVVNELGDIRRSFYNVYVIYTNEYRDYNGTEKCDVYVAEVDYSDFRIGRDGIRNFKTRCGWRWFSEENMKKDFERRRKNENGHYWIIAQDAEYENYTPKAIPLAGRFREVRHGWKNMQTAILPHDRNGDAYYDNVMGAIGNVDKSGYHTGVNNYAERLRQRKAERSKAEAKKWDGTAIFKAFETRINAVRQELGKIMTASADINYDEIVNATAALRSAAYELGNLKRGGYDSMEIINVRLRWTEDAVTKAEKAIVQ